MAKIAKYLLLIYQKVSINIGGSRCRYYPTCSHYAYESIEKHGLGKGLYLALKRLIKCNQLFPGGYDPVPK